MSSRRRAHAADRPGGVPRGRGRHRQRPRRPDRRARPDPAGDRRVRRVVRARRARLPGGSRVRAGRAAAATSVRGGERGVGDRHPPAHPADPAARRRHGHRDGTHGRVRAHLDPAGDSVRRGACPGRHRGAARRGRRGRGRPPRGAAAARGDRSRRRVAVQRRHRARAAAGCARRGRCGVDGVGPRHRGVRVGDRRRPARRRGRRLAAEPGPTGDLVVAGDHRAVAGHPVPHLPARRADRGLRGARGRRERSDPRLPRCRRHRPKSGSRCAARGRPCATCSRAPSSR